MDMQITSLLSHSIQEELASVNNTDVFSSSDIVRGITTTNEKNPKKSAFPKKATLLTFAYIDTGNADFRSAQRWESSPALSLQRKPCPAKTLSRASEGLRNIKESSITLKVGK